MCLFTRMSASFNENLRKVKASKRSGAGTSEVYVPGFRHFNEMKFLITTNQPRKGVSSTSISSAQLNRSSSTAEFESDQEKFDFANPSFEKRKKTKTTATNKTNSHSDFFEKASATIEALDRSSNMMSDEITGVCTIIEAELRKLNEKDRKEKIRQHLALHY